MSSHDGIFSTNVKFYASMLNFWKGFKLIRHENNNFGLEEPLFYNSLLGDNICTSNTIVKNLYGKKIDQSFRLDQHIV